jgi:hypothetical protein
MRFERQPEKHEQIGVGGYKRAYKISEGLDTPEVQLVMRHQYTHEQMKGLLYLNKIATILFPGKIAKVKAAGNYITEDSEIVSSQFRAEYHEHDPIHSNMQHQAKVFDGNYSAYNDEQQESVERFFEISKGRSRLTRRHPGIEAFHQAYEEAGFVNEDRAVKIYWGPQDVIIDEKGNFIYVDIDVPWDDPEEAGVSRFDLRCLRFDPVKLRATIATLDEPERTQAQGYYDRLMSLATEAGFIE